MRFRFQGPSGLKPPGSAFALYFSSGVLDPAGQGSWTQRVYSSVVLDPAGWNLRGLLSLYSEPVIEPSEGTGGKAPHSTRFAPPLSHNPPARMLSNPQTCLHLLRIVPNNLSLSLSLSLPSCQEPKSGPEAPQAGAWHWGPFWWRTCLGPRRRGN